MNLFKKIYKKIILFVIAMYVINIFISQQETLNTYQKEIEYYETQILAEETSKETLLDMKENVDSPEYIEQIAREKLSMYLPNERIYIGK